MFTHNFIGDLVVRFMLSKSFSKNIFNDIFAKVYSKQFTALAKLLKAENHPMSYSGLTNRLTSNF